MILVVRPRSAVRATVAADKDDFFLWKLLSLQRQAPPRGSPHSGSRGQVGWSLQDQGAPLSWLEEGTVCSDVNTWEPRMCLTSEKAESCITSPAWPCDSLPGTIPEVLLASHIKPSSSKWLQQFCKSCFLRLPLLLPKPSLNTKASCIQ